MNGQIHTRDPEPEPPPHAPKPPAGLILSGGIVPSPLLAELIGSGATVRNIDKPGPAPESRYRPSAALQEFIRVRDLTCRFPGCEQSAEFCDIDHTIAYPAGPTHASNLKCLCRKHHLLKTFWTGDRGWTDRQLPDGTVIWKSPTGKTYKTRPGSRIFFPAWNTTTAELPQQSAPVAQDGNRTMMMPKRQHTRATDRTRRIHQERTLNDTHVAERNRPPPF